MQLNELIEKLTAMQQVYGDRKIFIDAVPDGLLTVGEIDMNLDGDIVIWTAGEQ